MHDYLLDRAVQNTWMETDHLFGWSGYCCVWLGWECLFISLEHKLGQNVMMVCPEELRGSPSSSVGWLVTPMVLRPDLCVVNGVFSNLSGQISIGNSVNCENWKA